MNQKPIVHRIIACEKCKASLWEFKVLSHIEGDTPDKAVVGSTEWKSANPLVSTREPGNTIECPICERPFMKVDTKNKRQQMLFINPETLKLEREWL